ncbi:MAG: hypothetical protein VCB77_10405, partial [Alphaproteobacteria bacterium]
MNQTLPDDDTLNGLLSEAGSDLSSGQLRTLVHGVVAAPDDHDDEAWMALVVPQPSASLRAALATLKQATAAANDDGLDASPAPVE